MTLCLAISAVQASEFHHLLRRPDKRGGPSAGLMEHRTSNLEHMCMCYCLAEVPRPFPGGCLWLTTFCQLCPPKQQAQVWPTHQPVILGNSDFLHETERVLASDFY